MELKSGDEEEKKKEKPAEEGLREQAVTSWTTQMYPRASERGLYEALAVQLKKVLSYDTFLSKKQTKYGQKLK